MSSPAPRREKKRTPRKRRLYLGFCGDDSSSSSSSSEPAENTKSHDGSTGTGSSTNVSAKARHRLIIDDDEDSTDNEGDAVAAAAATQDATRTSAPPTNANASTNADAPAPTDHVGARVAKYFDDTLYLGTITSARRCRPAGNGSDSDDEQTEGPDAEEHWHVRYDDGDEEDYNSDELREALELFRAHENGGDGQGQEQEQGGDLLDTDEEEEEEETKGTATANAEEASKQRRKRLLDRRAAKRKKGDGSDNASNDDDDDDGAAHSDQPKKRKPRRRRRKMMSESTEARKAQAEERERARERKRWRCTVDGTGVSMSENGGGGKATNANGTGEKGAGAAAAAAAVAKVVINSARPDSEPAVGIAPDLAVRLKPHQIEGVRFMWKSLIHSIDAATNEAGRGAILAHSMGLGKSFQIVSFLHTVLLQESLPFRNAIVLGPKNTLYNWSDEFTHKWNADEDLDIHLIDPAVHKTIAERVRVVKRWHDDSSKERPGILLMSYDQFKCLIGQRPSKKQRTALRERLLSPGPDFCVLDEGHIIANPKTAVNKAVMGMKTRRRLILTGTPISNNLDEYYTMVAFVHPDLLSSSAEFRNRFVVPIKAGQYMDATDYDVRLMKRRVHVLNRKLKPVVHRRGYDILTQTLPPKFEYVICVRLDDIQKKLYRAFLERRKKGLEETSFFHAWHSLQRIWNHPRTIEYAEEERKENEKRAALKREMSDFIDDSSVDDSSVGSGHGFESEEEKSWHGSESEDEGDEEKKEDELVTKSASSDADGKTPSSSSPPSQVDRRSNGSPTVEPPVPQQWWESIFGNNWPEDLASESGKFQVLRDIVANLHLGDKLAIFSQSLGVLKLIEEWLEHSGGFGGDADDGVEFCKGVDFLRIDGSTASEQRQRFCNKMNDSDDPARLILISVRAGSLGINLVGVNRVVIFDCSFNPTHDVQAIFRAYRFGQTRPVSIYRLVASGSMEERIYRRQVEKSALFSRVVDDHQIERHFSRTDVGQMIRLLEDDDEAEEASKSKIKYKSHTDAPPSDLLFAKLLKEDGGRKLPRFHEHDSLLENKPEEELTEQEKKDAWAEFEGMIATEQSRQNELIQLRAAASAAANTGHSFTGQVGNVPPIVPGGVPFMYGQYPYHTQQQQIMPDPTTAPVMQSTSVSLVGIANYDIVRSIYISVPGPLGLDITQIDSTGKRDEKGQFANILRAKPGMCGYRCGLLDGDILLYPGTDKLISFDLFVHTLSKQRPLVLDVARAKNMGVVL